MREQALANSTLTGLISDRFYPSELPLIANPVFPCANFNFDVGIGADRDAPVIHEVSFFLNAWSNVSYDEAYSIYDAVFDVFEKADLKDTNVMALLFEESSPLEDFDSLSRTYSVRARWSGTAIDRT